MGENGCGKTTFIKLLCRLYDPTEGMILLNGIDIRKYNYREYLSVFSVVFQDFQLLSVSLGENVAAGSRDGTGTPLPAGRGQDAQGRKTAMTGRGPLPVSGWRASLSGLTPGLRDWTLFFTGIWMKKG